MTSPPVYTGVDVSKAPLDLTLPSSDEITPLPNSEKGIPELVLQLQQVTPNLVVLETTRGFELPVAAALAAGEAPVVVANPPDSGFHRAHGSARQGRPDPCPHARPLRAPAIGSSACRVGRNVGTLAHIPHDLSCLR